MCYMVISTLPKYTEIAELRITIDKYNMSFKEIQNKSLISQIEQFEILTVATKEQCDCDSAIGAFSNETNDLSLETAKLVKKGWSQSKIDRWILEQKLNKDKKIKGLNADAEKWINFIYELLHDSKVKRIGILKHWFINTIEDEKINLKGIEKAYIDDITSDFLLKLKDDVLYQFIIRK